MKTSHPSAVEMVQPMCPECGYVFPSPVDHPQIGRPCFDVFAVTCGHCEWEGHARFWCEQDIHYAAKAAV